MTSKEFVIWLQGLATGASRYNLLPSQWHEICDKLKTVNDNTQDPTELERRNPFNQGQTLLHD